VTHPLNKTLAYEDLDDEAVAPTYRDLRRFVWRWFLRGFRLGVNGKVRRRVRVRPQKMWEYSRALALTGATRSPQPLHILDVGGAMTLPVFYLGRGGHVTSLDIDQALVDETNRTAARARLPVRALAVNLVDEDPTAESLGAPGGFDRIYCLCVIEHILPPGQHAVAARMAKLLRPGGQMAITFDYGENARSEAPVRTPEDVEALRRAVGLPLLGNQDFADDGRRYPISRTHPEQPFTFGSLFFASDAKKSVGRNDA
jgi:SAM-dependent methyltransferase